MIQRIQSIFLLLAVILTGSLFLSQLIDLLTQDGQIYQMSALAITNATNGEVFNDVQVYPIAVLIGYIFLTGLLSIFLFKKRMLQARLTMMNMILSLALVGLIFFYGWLATDQLNADMTFQMIAIFPVVASILFFLARRRIVADELLVKSYDRIR